MAKNQYGSSHQGKKDIGIRNRFAQELAGKDYAELDIGEKEIVEGLMRDAYGN